MTCAMYPCLQVPHQMLWAGEPQGFNVCTCIQALPITAVDPANVCHGNLNVQVTQAYWQQGHVALR